MNPIWKPLAERDAPQQTEDRIPYTPEVTPAVVDFREAQRKKRDAAQQARLDSIDARLRAFNGDGPEAA